jgi:hypothetical protein
VWKSRTLRKSQVMWSTLGLRNETKFSQGIQLSGK